MEKKSDESRPNNRGEHERAASERSRAGGSQGELGLWVPKAVFLPDDPVFPSTAKIWVQTEGSKIGLEWGYVKMMYEPILPDFHKTDAGGKQVEIQVVAPWEVPGAVVATPDSVGVTELDLVADFLYSKGNCGDVFDDCSDPVAPQEVFPMNAKPGDTMLFHLHYGRLIVRVLDFSHLALSSLALLLPPEKRRGDGEFYRFVCERPWRQVALAYIYSIVDTCTLGIVEARPEGWVLRGEFDAAIARTKSRACSGKGALRPVQMIMNAYPVEVRFRRYAEGLKKRAYSETVGGGEIRKRDNAFAPEREGEDE